MQWEDESFSDAALLSVLCFLAFVISFSASFVKVEAMLLPSLTPEFGRLFWQRGGVCVWPQLELFEVRIKVGQSRLQTKTAGTRRQAPTARNARAPHSNLEGSSAEQRKFIGNPDASQNTCFEYHHAARSRLLRRAGSDGQAPGPLRILRAPTMYSFRGVFGHLVITGQSWRHLQEHLPGPSEPACRGFPSRDRLQLENWIDGEV
ncbi:hypothetical protein KC361_g101 [Hortaea werneckii]|nr:hypothetical protein KC361_g101 [Hortaea werneckii]